MVVLHSSFLVAHHNERDVHHPAARRAMDDLRSNAWGIALLPEYVFTDAAIVAVARRRKAPTVVTFDEDFQRFSDLRVLPE